MSTQDQIKSIATGADLNPETWSDFVARLHHDCVGKGVDDHCTADAIFIVQARRVIFGIDTDYSDKRAVICEEGEWFSPMEYWDDLDDQGQTALNDASDEYHGHLFTEIHEHEQWEMLSELTDHTVTGWDERWEYVCAHFTRDAADAFIRRKKHDYRDGLRVYVDAQVHCWEYNAIKAAILDGRIVLADTANASQEAA